MAKNLFLILIRIYQVLISPFLGNNCRFYPSCSEHTRLCVEKYGILKGCQKGLAQLIRCHSWN